MNITFIVSSSSLLLRHDYIINGKGDGFEGLCSDHFINGTKRLYVFYLLYSLYF